MSRDLTHSFTVDQSPEQVYESINDVRHWWSDNVVGDPATLNAEWVYLAPDIHFSKQRTTVLKPGERVEWLVVDSHLDFLADQHEWTGTTIRFDITRAEGPRGRTRLTLTHLGLTSDMECFDVCETAWGQYVLGSLRDLIQSGSGQPGDFSNQESLDAALAGTVRVPDVS
ncbi:SRPBCC domain-containing protein [Intrasporangium calvum]|uniref:SRPBCC domain-containing protein n=1 Tax=Intrasporangium calvum TaxID=53358 RepID=A0ABT5GI88_9MICO|nr:SRPBCC domain-containing protein [Intrasporangium calvum]MDC5697620.1 SRPBCC domain-containing protein [Intrasporangium calvum]